MRKIGFGFLILLLFLTACSTGKVKGTLIEQKGNIQLKNQTTFSDSVFVGVGFPMDTEQEAIQSAKENAVIQIIESLGVKAEIFSSLNVKEMSTENKSVIDVAKETSIKWKAKQFLPVKVSETYVEIREHRGKQFYLAWGKVFFDNQAHDIFWKSFYQHQNDIFQSISKAKTKKNELGYILALATHLSYLKEHAPTDFWAWKFEEYQQYAIFRDFFEKEIKNFQKELTIHYLEPVETGTKLLITFQGRGIKNTPVTIQLKKEQEIFRLTTNKYGAIIIPKAVKTYDSISYTIGNTVKEETLLWTTKIIAPDPLSRASNKIYIEEKSEQNAPILAAKLKRKLEQMDYNVSLLNDENSIVAVIIEGKTELKKELFPPDFFQAEATVAFSIVQMDTQKVIFMYDIPNARFSNCIGYGKKKRDATRNALNLSSLSNRNELVQFLSASIDEYTQAILKARYSSN